MDNESNKDNKLAELVRQLNIVSDLLIQKESDNHELNRKIGVLSNSLSEKAEENVLLQEQNKTLLIEYDKIKKINKMLKAKDEKNENDNKIADKKYKKNKQLVEIYEEEINDIRYNSKKLHKEICLKEKKDKDSEVAHIMKLNADLSFFKKKFEYRSVENSILRLKISKQKRKNNNYKELLQSYENNVKSNNNNREDVDALKLQLHLMQQDCLSYKQSIEIYEEKLTKTQHDLSVSIRMENAEKMKYIRLYDNLTKDV
jgi:hypothetical protein